MKTGSILAAALIGSAICGVAGTALGRDFTLTDLRHIVSLSDPQVSPDGREIAVVVTTPDWTTDKATHEIDLIDIASGARRPLTRYREDVASPRWSPDGKRLAFITADTTPALPPPADGKAPPAADTNAKYDQVFVLPMDGGDAERVTDASRDVVSFSWSPDGKTIAYVAADVPANEKAIKAHDDAFRVTENNFLVRAALTPSHLWVVPSAGGKAKRLTEGAFSLYTDQQDSAPEPAWSPDGRTIAFSRFPDPYWALSYKSVVDTVAADGGTPSTLVALQGATTLTYAPSGDAFAFTRPRNGDENNGTAVYVSDGDRTFDVTRALSRDVGFYVWLPDGKTLLVVAADGTHSAMWEQAVDGGAKRVDLGGVEIADRPSVSPNGVVAFVGATAGHGDELYVMTSPGAAARRLTDLNGFLDSLSLGRTTTIEWHGPDGFREDGVLTYPPGYERGRKYPLVLEIHGGPEGSSTVRFSPLSQLLAAAGFLVFEPNYRGSNDLGDAYQHAIYRDTGEGPGKDVMAGLAAVEKMGIVDRDRIGVSGWSYGGYMTDWLSSRYPRAWKAAVSGAALNDWVMDYTVAYYQQGDTYFFGGSPWTARDYQIWREQSPIAHAQNVKAPTLIMGDVGDPNVPLVNSYEWYHALRDNGVEVQFFAYPADTHFPGDVVRMSDVFRRWVGWMSTHLAERATQ
ncbi:MAG TPA: S9 family peptidase [Steroidobacteraceae bacterium]|nr:S9 family peptidase [Steroidobacteraceae bacterium]